MFPHRFYGQRYFGNRYFGQAIGHDPVGPGGGGDDLTWFIRRRGWHVRPLLRQR